VDAKRPPLTAFCRRNLSAARLGFNWYALVELRAHGEIAEATARAHGLDGEERAHRRRLRSPHAITGSLRLVPLA
jgi:hypothetical protein